MKRQNTTRNLIALTSLLFILLIPSIAKGQYVGRYTLKGNIQKDTLIDSITGVKYIIDTARIHITAIDTNGNQLWKTDPIVDAKIEAYRVQRPVIVYFVFETDRYNKNKQIIAITYDNSQFGYVNKLTGKFDFLGQD